MSSSKISVRTCKGLLIICCDQILYCQGDGRYTRIFMNNGESHLITRVLKDYETILPKDVFFRIHKSCIVNLSFVKSYNINNHHQLELNDHTILTVAKRRCKCFLNKLHEVYPC
jgi:two-component system, LytTR family, response regulator